MELTTVPGIPIRSKDVDFYSREYPLESYVVENTATLEWAPTQFSTETLEYRKFHNAQVKPLIAAAQVSADLPATTNPAPTKDIVTSIRRKAKQLGFGEVGFTKFDLRYVYASKKSWVKYSTAICLAMEQDYEATQSLPSLEAEHTHLGTYRAEQQAALALAAHIRKRGYHAQIHSPNDNSSVYIPMFVQAGLGQLGANGQLLSPFFGSRSRLMLITTDANIAFDKPVDFGMHRFCQKCQICVNRCPGRAITRSKTWFRGVEKNKLIVKRCRPILARYEGCGVCMKVCPIQRYGMKAVMKHYIATGQILGKHTHGLEGYSLANKGYFGPGELPHFSTSFYDFPTGRSEDWLFKKFKTKLQSGEFPIGSAGDDELMHFKGQVAKYLSAGLGNEMIGQEFQD